MNMDLVVATSNPGKFRELALGLKPLGWNLSSLLDYDITLPTESGASFEDNALLKATYTATKTQIPALADDSGLEVEALGGEPGIYSARFGGRESDIERNIYLLERLNSVPEARRGARFTAVLVLAYPDSRAEYYRGEAYGRILEEPVGEGGFGYDPLFFLPEVGRTFAQLEAREKEAYSHRGRALAALLRAYHAAAIGG